MPAQVPVLTIDTPREAPAWAVMERHLINVLNEAGETFVRTYTNPDGTLRWKRRYEGGMNSSDDLYEAFRGMSMAHVIGGSKKLDTLHRWVWEGITRQFTRYGNIYREFDSNWDWMHHGEGYTSFYTLGLADPNDEKFRERSRRFAAMYIGEDREAPNYDPKLNIIRAVMNGSRGPKMQWNTRDWIPTNANLTYYHLPYNDIPGVDTSTGWINDNTFAVIVKTMSDRMARGDVPINMTVTPLIADAYLYTGETKYRDWITRYVGGWVERTRANNGITPDNVGLNGKIGEYTGGHWWGGYYGWRWPRGGVDVVRANLTGAKSALLVSGDYKWLNLARSQMELMRDKGRVEDGVHLAPARHGEQGWHHYTPEPVYPWVWLWILSQEEADWRQIERLSNNPNGGADLDWAMFLRGRNPGFPVESLRADLRLIQQRLDKVLNEHGDPETWFDAHWMSRNPVQTAALERLTMGAVPVDLRGEMLHAQLRYFDAETNSPGLPPDVAALISGITKREVEVELVNLSPVRQRRLYIQGGAYGEHRISKVKVTETEESLEVAQPFFELRLAPASGTTLKLTMERYESKPTYHQPADRLKEAK